VTDRRPGLAAAAAALGAVWLLHAAVRRAPFTPFSAAEWLVRRTPGGLATRAIELLGHGALDILIVVAVVAVLAIGYLAGSVRPLVLGGVALVLGALAGALDPMRAGAGFVALSSVVGALAAALTAELLRAPAGGAPTADAGRRRVVAGIALGAGSVVLGGLGVVRAAAKRAAVGIVRADRLAVIATDPSFVAPSGLTPRLTSRRDHYVVDIDLLDPSVGESAYRLRITGAVASPLALTLDELRAMRTVEQVTTLTCISNPVGGNLISTARWTGVRVRDLLARAKPHGNAMFLEAKAADGYIESFPMDLVMRDEFLAAFGMNGLLLPREHGFPVRLIVPGRYGMKNVKWVTDLVLRTTDITGYWEVRGWDAKAIIRTESRFDVPSDGATVSSPFVAAGIAWAGDRGVQAVQVSTDDGNTWREAVLERAPGALTWRRWKVDLALGKGDWTLQCRAIDGKTDVEDRLIRAPHPSGASGYHTIEITVR